MPGMKYGNMKMDKAAEKSAMKAKAAKKAATAKKSTKK